MPAVARRFPAIGGQTFRVYEAGWQGSKLPKLIMMVTEDTWQSLTIESLRPGWME